MQSDSYQLLRACLGSCNAPLAFPCSISLVYELRIRISICMGGDQYTLVWEMFEVVERLNLLLLLLPSLQRRP